MSGSDAALRGRRPLFVRWGTVRARRSRARLRREAVVGRDAGRGSSARLQCREAVGLSVLSGGFKRLLGWLEISLRVIVSSCC